VPLGMQCRNLDNQSRKWKKGLQGSDKIMSRIYVVSPNDSELYCLCIVFLHIPGATSFKVYLQWVVFVAALTLKPA